MTELQFTIPLDPKSKKNSQKVVKWGNRFGIVQSDTFRDYERECGKYIPRTAEPIDRPIAMTCVFYREKRGKVDLSNLLAAIDDVLVTYGVLKDDNRDIIASHDGSRVYWDKENPRTEVTITEITEYERWEDLIHEKGKTAKGRTSVRRR